MSFSLKTLFAPAYRQSPTYVPGWVLQSYEKSVQWGGCPYKDFALDQRLIYTNNRNALETAIDECDEKRSPKIAAYAFMLSEAREIGDDLAQALLINAWTNLAIGYDKVAYDNDLPARTQVQAIEDGRGICDEIAQIKLGSLEITGGNATGAFCLGARGIRDNKEQDKGHATIVKKIDDVPWTLDDNCSLNRINGAAWPALSEKERLIYVSLMEPAPIKMGVGGAVSHIWPNKQMSPVLGYNYNHIHRYDQSWVHPSTMKDAPPVGKTVDILPYWKKNDKTGRRIRKLLAPLL
jgi:hypothetical protein